MINSCKIKIVGLSLILYSLCALKAATVIAGNGWDGNNTGTSTVTNNFTVSVVADGFDWVYTWTKTGDLDGLGNSDDTLSFELRLEAFTGSTYDGVDLILGDAFDLTEGGTLLSPDQHFGPNGTLHANNSFQLSIENIVYISGDGGAEIATFDGFNEISVFNNPQGTLDYYIGTTNAEVVTPLTAIVEFDPTDLLTITSTNTSERFRDLDFSFTVAVVPEPSSMALLALGLTSLAFTRRRKS